MVKIEIKSREFIKPSTPTPLTLKTFNLSLLDQLSPPAYVPMIFYYAPHFNPNDPKPTTPSRINNLKQSLSTTLNGFYPLAGRVRDNLFIDCNDEGVEFLEATADCPISDILKQPQTHHLDMFLPYDYHLSKSKYSNIDQAQLAVQANVFTCGGMAIGVCVLHKIVDGITFTTLMSNWAALSKGTRVSHDPLFVGPSLFPPRDLTGMFPAFDIPKAKCRTKRFVFDTSKITSLRSRVMLSGCLDHYPSRVEVLSALIWKCAINVSKSKSKSVLTQAVNLRGRMDPPLPGHASGNLLWLSVASSNGSLNIHELINHIKRSLTKFDEEHVKKMQGQGGLAVLGETLKELGDMMVSDVDIYRFTSLGKFELYGTDFGWGRPVWVSSAGLEFKNVVVLMETRGGDGVEAWVTLEEEDMVVFEKNEELLSFVSSSVFDSVLSSKL